MNQPNGSGDTGDKARADVDAAQRLFIASSRNIPIRLATAAAIAVAALSALPP